MPAERRYGHLVQEYYVERVRALSRRRAAARAKITTRAQVLRLRDEVRAKLRRCFGAFPARTPLKARILGQVEHPRFVIQKVIYESRPDFPVTANLYLPRNGRAPWPAVLGVCGHSALGKAEPAYQAFMQNLAAQGYLALILDPISQGERLQYLGCRGASLPRGCCDEHNMAGNQMRLVGDFFGSWRTWDAIRGLDYLLSRPEADRSRVGITGNSGGGTVSTYVSAFDGRLTMSAPSCFVTRYLSNLENELPSDAEQMPPRFLAEGLDMADFFVAQIPRPTILLGQNNDFFDRRGLESSYEELRRLYAVLGAERDVELFIGPQSHGFSRHNREAMYRFFGKHAGLSARPNEREDLAAENPEALWAAPKGQVRSLKARCVFDFTGDAAQRLARGRKPLSRRALLKALSLRLSLPPRAGAPHYRVLRQQPVLNPAGHILSRFGVETEDRIQALLYVLAEGGAFFHFPKGREALLYVPHLSAADDILHGKAPRAKMLFAMDARGLGAVMAQTCRTDDFFAPYDSDFLYASFGQSLGESYCGRRVHDLLRVLDLFAAQGYHSVHLVGRGLGSLTSLFAACLHPLVKRVTLINALLSYHELTQVPVQRWPLSALVEGALQDFDLPDCYRFLAARKVEVVSPWTSQMRPWDRRKLRRHLQALGLESVRVAGRRDLPATELNSSSC